MIAPGWEEPSGDTIDKNRFLTPLLHQVPTKSNFSARAFFLIFWHTRLGGKVKWEYLEDIILPPRQNILGVSGCYKKSWEMGKHRGDFTQNFNRDDARLLFLCPKLSENPTHKFKFFFSKWTIDNCQGWAGMTFGSSGTGTGMDNSIPKVRERENPFPQFGNGKGM